MTIETAGGEDRGPNSGNGPDPRLQKLLHLWDRLDEDHGLPNSLGVTVVIRGVVYSGLLIAGRVWAQKMAGLLSDAPGSGQVKALSVFFDDMRQSYEEAGAADESKSYLHLASVTVGLPRDSQPTSLLLRVRIEEVSGWSIGTIGQLPAFTPSVPAGGSPPTE